MTIPHNRNGLLKISNKIYCKFVEDFFERELASDGNDITSGVLFGNKKIEAKAVIIAKENGLFAGREEIEHILSKKSVQQKWLKKDAQSVSKGEKILELTGDAKKLLKLERVILNILSRMSGIAGVTKKIVDKLPKNVAVAATRKTLWGLLDKKAVAVGGGLSHRLNLSDGILIKENHLQVVLHRTVQSKPIAEVLSYIDKPRNLKLETSNLYWEIEVETEKEFFEAINNLPKKRPGVIMFDNFKPAKIKSIIGKVKKPKGIFFEASGGIKHKNYLNFAKTGVDVISCGFLTKEAHSLDLSMKINQLKGKS